MELGYVSATPLGAAANQILNRPEPFTHTYRTYFRPYRCGRLLLRLWHSNAVDSTWDRGQEATGGEPGGKWRIESAYLGDGGLEPDGRVKPDSITPVTFGGTGTKDVLPGETFASDEVSVQVEEGHYMVFSWTLTALEPGKSIPYNVEGMLATAYDGPGNWAGEPEAGEAKLSENLLVMPSFIGEYRPDASRFVLLGDSITQGVRTVKDAYEYWAARIGSKLAGRAGVWNIGSGWGRAYDAAAEGSPWLHKAQYADELLVMLGVNDIDIGERSAGQLMADLSALICRLKERNPDMRILLSTVPPFNFTGHREQVWRSVNEQILNQPPKGADFVYPVGDCLSCPKPEDHRIKPEYMSDRYDPHPNGAAGQAVAEAFMDWYRTQGVSGCSSRENE
ncbi:GDSL family lipase [Paenibacillus yonginensis]|uniref:GDSL family lipase n=2 Tax=Paenibacillus yonginensis TaxID=1462996 RepID=A0A1B1N6T2_9BACL|nr:GDSL family lipase [Paenibacillus yonginensis]